MPHLQDALEIAIAALLVLISDFFVGAEFALVKVLEVCDDRAYRVRVSRLDAALPPEI
jgi:CBS domain containing-hemolysin-like protein